MGHTFVSSCLSWQRWSKVQKCMGIIQVWIFLSITSKYPSIKRDATGRNWSYTRNFFFLLNIVHLRPSTCVASHMVTANNDGLLPGEILKKDVDISTFVFFTLDQKCANWLIPNSNERAWSEIYVKGGSNERSWKDQKTACHAKRKSYRYHVHRPLIIHVQHWPLCTCTTCSLVDWDQKKPDDVKRTNLAGRSRPACWAPDLSNDWLQLIFAAEP
jgi:hypothetical protein